MRDRDKGRRSARIEREPMNFDEARVDGLGVFLIRALMDGVSYDVSGARNGTRHDQEARPSGR